MKNLCLNRLQRSVSAIGLALAVGEWHHGKQDGRGTLIFADGSRYLGDWAQGLRHGQGAMDWAAGRKYFGQWARG